MFIINGACATGLTELKKIGFVKTVLLVDLTKCNDPGVMTLSGGYESESQVNDKTVKLFLLIL